MTFGIFNLFLPHPLFITSLVKNCYQNHCRWAYSFYTGCLRRSILLRKLDSKSQGRYEILLLATIIFVILQSPANYISYMKVVGI